MSCNNGFRRAPGSLRNINCKFENNNAHDGSAIYAENFNIITNTNCSFLNNETPKNEIYIKGWIRMIKIINTQIHLSRTQGDVCSLKTQVKH